MEKVRVLMNGVASEYSALKLSLNGHAWGISKQPRMQQLVARGHAQLAQLEIVDEGAGSTLIKLFSSDHLEGVELVAMVNATAWLRAVWQGVEIMIGDFEGPVATLQSGGHWQTGLGRGELVIAPAEYFTKHSAGSDALSALAALGPRSRLSALAAHQLELT